MLYEFPEALLMAWVVTEQLFDETWSTWRSELEPVRRARLGDGRVYSAAVRIEMLCTAGVVEKPLADLLHAARTKRNDLAHRAAFQADDARTAIEAMVAMLSWRLGEAVQSPLPVTLQVHW